jgi:hypothetical protein
MVQPSFGDREREIARIYSDPGLSREEKIRRLDSMPEPERASTMAEAAGGGRRNVTQAEIDAAEVARGKAAEAERIATDAAASVQPGRGNYSPKQIEDIQYQRAQKASAAASNPEVQIGEAEIEKPPDLDTGEPTPGAGQAGAERPGGFSAADVVSSLAGQGSGPQYAQVGSDTFRPSQRVIKKPGEIEGQEDRDVERTLSEDLQRSARDEQAKAAEIAAQQDRAGQILAERARQQVDEQFAKQQRERDQHLQRMDADYQKEAALVRDAKIDPNRYYANQSTGDQIAQFFALLISGASSRISHSKDNLREEIQKAIDRDIDAQKANLQQLDKRIQSKQTFYDIASQRYKSEEARDAAAKALAYEQIGQRLARFSEAAKDPVRKAALQEEQQIWEQQRIDREEARKQAQAGEVTEQEVFDPRRTVQVGGGGNTRAKILEQMAKEGKLTNEVLANMGWDPKFYVPALEMYATRDSDVDKLNKQYSTVAGAVNSVDKIKNLMKQGIAYAPGSKERGVIESEIQQLIGKVREPIVGPGTMSETDRSALQTSIGDPTKFFSIDDNSTARLDNLRSNLIAAARNDAGNTTLIQGPPPRGYGTPNVPPPAGSTGSRAPTVKGRPAP